MENTNLTLLVDAEKHTKGEIERKLLIIEEKLAHNGALLSSTSKGENLNS